MVGGQRLSAKLTKAYDPDPAPIPSPDRYKRKEAYEKNWALLPLGTLQLTPETATIRLTLTPGPQAGAVEVKSLVLKKME